MKDMKMQSNENMMNKLFLHKILKQVYSKQECVYVWLYNSIKKVTRNVCIVEEKIKDTHKKNGAEKKKFSEMVKLYLVSLKCF